MTGLVPRVVGALLLLAGCRGRVSLGDRDLDGGAPPSEPTVCPAAPSELLTLAEPDPALGTIRSLAAFGGAVYVLFERGPTASTMVGRVTSSGAVTELAAFGSGASSMAAASDAVFVAVDREIFRVAATGAVSSVRADGPVSTIAWDRGRVYWAVASTGEIFAWDGQPRAPVRISKVGGAPIASLVVSRGVIYASGALVSAVETVDGVAREVTAACGVGRLAASPYEDEIVCARESAVVRVRRDGTQTLIADQPGASDVLGAAGRAAWIRLSASGVADAVVTLPLDGPFGPSNAISDLEAARALATDGCALYVVTGRRIVRRGL